MFVRFFYTILAVAVCHSAQAQYQTVEWKQYIGNGNLPYHKLSAGEFKINDHEDTGDLFWINPWLDYRFETQASNDIGLIALHISAWRVYSGFDRSSGHKSNFNRMQEALPYVQGILDIQELYARQFALTPLSELPVGRGINLASAEDDLTEKLRLLEKQIQAQIHSEIARYDTATDDGLNKKVLTLWRSNLALRLKQAHIADHYTGNQ